MKKRTSKRAAKKKAQKTIEEVKDLDLSVDSSGEGGEDGAGAQSEAPTQQGGRVIAFALPDRESAD